MINEILKLKNIFFYIIGHNNPDVDSIVSAMLLKDIFILLDIKCDYAIFENDYPDNYNSKVVNSFLDYNPVIIKNEDIDKNKYFLVDHNNLNQSIKNKDLVVGCIDHHPNSNEIPNIINGEYCCNALFIYDLFKDVYEFNTEQKKAIYIAFLMDSKFMKSSRFKEKDKKLVQELGCDNFFNEYFEKYFVPTDLSSKDVFYKNGYKTYKFEKLEFESSYIESLNTALLEKYKDFIINYKGDFLGIWYDYTNDKTYAFFKNKNKIKEYKFDYIASRGSEIIEKILIT